MSTLKKTVKRQLEYLKPASTENQKILIENCKPFSFRIWGQDFPIDKKITGLRFLHVGKCGGTSIMKAFLEKGILLEEYHMKKPPVHSETQYFIWIRNPFSRYVSAFNHSKAIVEFDTSNIDHNELTLNNTPAPMKIANKMKYGFAISPGYDFLVDQFESANALAESLSSSNKKLRRNAYSLMQSPKEHIFKGIGWYCDNGRWLEANRQRTFLAGTLENINESFEKLLGNVSGCENYNLTLERARKGDRSLPKYLSSVAEKNLFKFYKNSDYKALEKMKIQNLITEKLYEDYHVYSK